MAHGILTGWTPELDALLRSHGWYDNRDEEEGEGAGDYTGVVGGRSVWIWAPGDAEWSRHLTKWTYDASNVGRNDGCLPTDILFDDFAALVVFALIEAANHG